MNIPFLLYLGGTEVLFIVLGVFLPIIALIDVIKHEFAGNNKILWALIIIFFPFFGSVLYFIIGRKTQKFN